MLQLSWRKRSPGREDYPCAQPRVQPGLDWPAVLFVCTANRIRSPLAEYLLLDLLRRRGSEDRPWRVESAGVWAQDDMPVPDAVYQVGLEHGLNLGNHRSRSVAALNLDRFDLILAMERKHAATLGNEFPHLRERVLTLGEAVSGYEFEIVDPPRHASRAIRATARELAQILSWGLDGLRQRVEASCDRRQVGARPH